MKLTRKGFLEFRFQDTAKVNSKAVATCDNYRSSRAGGVVRTSRARFDQIILIAKQKIISAISQISFCGDFISPRRDYNCTNANSTKKEHKVNDKFQWISLKRLDGNKVSISFLPRLTCNLLCIRFAHKLRAISNCITFHNHPEF